jgi:hypothetical protein
VVGCDYAGLPPHGARVRNPIGASMALRRAAVVAAGGFSEQVGRVGALPSGCEETELGIRLAAADPGAVVVRDTSSAVDHLVPRDRQTVRYFVRRCWHEGRSKAVLAVLVGTADGLSSERAYTTRVLPLGVLRHLAALARGDVGGPARAALVVLGLLVTAAGYADGRRKARAT